mmetsp:Transcript_10242/g.27928  ORF Transcript_10242/g.27928 Transcript_10242/m.27928 type:complete len:222 (+) Transcript_10242:445-1110(+)
MLFPCGGFAAGFGAAAAASGCVCADLSDASHPLDPTSGPPERSSLTNRCTIPCTTPRPSFTNAARTFSASLPVSLTVNCTSGSSSWFSSDTYGTLQLPVYVSPSGPVAVHPKETSSSYAGITLPLRRLITASPDTLTLPSPVALTPPESTRTSFAGINSDSRFLAHGRQSRSSQCHPLTFLPLFPSSATFQRSSPSPHLAMCVQIPVVDSESPARRDPCVE